MRLVSAASSHSHSRELSPCPPATQQPRSPKTGLGVWGVGGRREGSEVTEQCWTCQQGLPRRVGTREQVAAALGDGSRSVASFVFRLGRSRGDLQMGMLEKNMFSPQKAKVYGQNNPKGRDLGASFCLPRPRRPRRPLA